MADTTPLDRDWDAQLEAAQGNEVLAAVGILRCSQRAHAAWRDYALEHPDEETHGDAAWHQRCVDEYEKIIGVIDRLAAREIMHTCR